MPSTHDDRLYQSDSSASGIGQLAAVGRTSWTAAPMGPASRPPDRLSRSGAEASPSRPLLPGDLEPVAATLSALDAQHVLRRGDRPDDGHADLLHHPLGGDVQCHGLAPNRADAQLREAFVDKGIRALGRIPLAPRAPAEPVSELDLVQRTRPFGA